MPMHGRVSNETYVRRVVHFAKAEKRSANHIRHKAVWHIYDSRSGKLLTDPCDSRAQAWKSLADKIRENGGSLINHSGSTAIQTVLDSRRDVSAIPNERTPQRIQRKRTKGWKAPEGAVSCTRPGRYGNPFRVGDYVMRGDVHGDRGPFSFSFTITTAKYADSRYTHIADAATAVEWFRWYASNHMQQRVEELRGKDLMCWCPLGTPCHADVLLELANKEKK